MIVIYALLVNICHFPYDSWKIITLSPFSASQYIRCIQCHAQRTKETIELLFNTPLWVYETLSNQPLTLISRKSEIQDPLTKCSYCQNKSTEEEASKQAFKLPNPTCITTADMCQEQWRLVPKVFTQWHSRHLVQLNTLGKYLLWKVNRAESLLSINTETMLRTVGSLSWLFWISLKMLNHLDIPQYLWTFYIFEGLYI